MPKPLEVDWNTARALYLRGDTLEQVAQRLGVKVATVRQRAARYSWKRDAVAVTDSVSHAVTSSVTLSLQERAAKWSEQVAGIVEKHLGFVANKDPGALKLNEVETLTRILGNTDATARRTFGLDKPDSARQAAVGVKVNLRIDTASGAGDKTQAIDAQVVDDSAPSASDA